MKKIILSICIFIGSASLANVPFCNISELNQDGSPTTNSAVKEFKATEELVLETPNKNAQLIAFWNEIYEVYQMSLLVGSNRVNSIIEKPSKSGYLNIWMNETSGYSAQCRFDLE